MTYTLEISYSYLGDQILCFQDDGWVHAKFYTYPLPASHQTLNQTSADVNSTDIRRNYNAQLT